MKVVILAGGLGTRISEESHLKPKPMIEIGERPILWHIMKEYSHYGFNEFIICLGYKQHVVKEYFADYYLYSSDVTFDLKENSFNIHNNHSEPWKVTLVDTGLNTMTGGRLKRVKNYIGGETFMMTYGDGVSDVDINALLDFHRAHKKIGTITAISVDQRFGVLDIAEDDTVHAFAEKDEKDSSVVNGGYMVFEPQVFDYIEGDKTVFEKETLSELAKLGELGAYKHKGFWQCMDTQREKLKLEQLWASGKAPWKVWE